MLPAKKSIDENASEVSSGRWSMLDHGGISASTTIVIKARQHDRRSHAFEDGRHMANVSRRQGARRLKQTSVKALEPRKLQRLE